MNEQIKKNLLDLLKLDLGITHDLRDAYFNNLIVSSQHELKRMGIVLDFESIDDQMLIVDYAAWSYRKRQEDIPLSRNLQFRINNRVIQKAGNENAVN
ncbi:MULTISPECIES: hypothetical protein [Bacillus]|uniref:hypothetical protein n=1 Tax=Bacillus TaxID=1386 RepID=UPI000BE66EBD|nr:MULTISPECIES: hypothetical protein [Bacillus]PDM38674.1 hypothetical protein CMV37_00425 [Bacillus cereus]MDA1690238.1 hypothetical protein [Bacillus cereus group sp. TH147LC]MDK7546457.1 hypothetical protein [Bacillus pacificus]MDK7550525.1 hypothetical protein [Bacillus pacificus]MDK7566071.1 hypothetical protein [Bacillus pacificus]